MSIRSFIVNQLGDPSGRFGRALLRVLNRANAGMNRTTLRALDLRPADHLLEIGFGGGDLLARALDAAPTARVVGIERSPDAVGVARRRFAREIEQGRVAIHEADAVALPFGDGAFTAVCTVNTVYFWPDPRAVLAEVRRVLRTGGRVALCYGATAPGGGEAQGVRSYTPDEVEALLASAGFAEAKTEQARDVTNGRYFCTLAMV